MKLFYYIFILFISFNLSSCGKSGRKTKAGGNIVSNTYSKRTKKSHANNHSKPVELEKTHTGKIESKNVLSGVEVFKMFNTAVFMIYTSDGYHAYQGSGFFIDDRGLAVSNYHVFEGTSVGAEEIHTQNNQTLKVREVIHKDKDKDFILFRVEMNGAKSNWIPISNRKLNVAEKIYTIGSPRGLENTFSSGEISQLRGNHYIQISAPIDHGSSGGALINSYGEVIGITSGGLDESGANLNYAIDIRVIKPYL